MKKIAAALFMTFAIAALPGCKTADEGPRPFVMPANPVINVPTIPANNGTIIGRKGQGRIPGLMPAKTPTSPKQLLRSVGAR